jgi:hypothetical protein
MKKKTMVTKKYTKKIFSDVNGLKVIFRGVFSKLFSGFQK